MGTKRKEKEAYMFITEEDYKVVIGEQALKVITQTSETNRLNAEMEAQEEISGYLRPRYDCTALFAADAEQQEAIRNNFPHLQATGMDFSSSGYTVHEL